jgi:hypothetical protein
LYSLNFKDATTDPRLGRLISTAYLELFDKLGGLSGLDKNRGVTVSCGVLLPFWPAVDARRDALI